MSRKQRPRGRSGINVEQVRQLASLSRLTLSGQEEERLIGELSSILEYFKVVEAVEDEVQVGKMAREADMLRPDEVGPSTPEELLKGVPQRKGRLVKAPRVF